MNIESFFSDLKEKDGFVLDQPLAHWNTDPNLTVKHQKYKEHTVYLSYATAEMFKSNGMNLGPSICFSFQHELDDDVYDYYIPIVDHTNESMMKEISDKLKRNLNMLTNA